VLRFADADADAYVSRFRSSDFAGLVGWITLHRSTVLGSWWM
jgi:hypothetical protein